MFRRRLRDTPTADELAAMYARPHDHSIYGYGHHLRVQLSIELAHWMVHDFKIRSVADLSCGNAAIANALRVRKRYLGDFAPGYDIVGPLEETIHQLPERVGLFICSETIEHLDNPDGVLSVLRDKADYLLLSTPIGENDLGNPEHLWGWDQQAVEAMLLSAAWQPAAHVDLLLKDTYSYQLWCCR